MANLKRSDLPAADRVFRLAFGTQFQLPDPMTFAGDSDPLTARFGANPGGAWGAWMDDQLVGSCFGSLWGSLGIIGPLTVAPALWGRGIGQQLLKPTIGWLKSNGARDLGLSTIPTSPGHLMLYRKFGFYPRFLYAIMLKPVEGNRGLAAFSRYSMLTPAMQQAALRSVAALSDAWLEGMDFDIEIASVFNQGIGETLLIGPPADAGGFGICHFGSGSEAESRTCYLKVGAVSAGPGVEQRFKELLDAVQRIAAESGCRRIRAGVCYARVEAMEAMFRYGFTIEKSGVTMHHHNHEGYNHPGVYMIDDWR